MADFRITGGRVTLPSACVTDESIATPASGQEIDADKLEHLYIKQTNFALAIGGTPATREEIVHVATTAGVIRSFSAMLYDTGTSVDCDFDLKKNGTTCLSAAVNITHSDADRTVKDGTLSVMTFAADDVLSIALTATTTTGALGPYAHVVIEETAA